MITPVPDKNMGKWIAFFFKLEHLSQRQNTINREYLSLDTLYGGITKKMNINCSWYGNRAQA